MSYFLMAILDLWLLSHVYLFLPMQYEVVSPSKRLFLRRNGLFFRAKTALIPGMELSLAPHVGPKRPVTRGLKFFPITGAKKAPS